MSSNRTPPAGLGVRGRAFYKAVLGMFDPLPAQVELLHEAARQVDELDELRAAIRESGSVVPGSKGQPRAHPLYAEVARGRANLARLVAALNFEAEDPEEEPPAPVDLRRVMTAQQMKASKAGRTSARHAAARREGRA